MQLNRTSNPIPVTGPKASPRTMASDFPSDPVVDFKRDKFSQFSKATRSRLTGMVEMSVAVNVISLSEIDTVSQRFTSEVVIRAATTNLIRDKIRVQGTEEEVTPKNWEPRLRFLNLLSTTTWERQEKMTGDGELAFKYHVSGTFSEQMELFDFPFDAQDLTFTLSSAIPADKIVMRELQPSIGKDQHRQTSAIQNRNFAESNVYKLADNLRFKEEISDTSESTSGVKRPMLAMSMKIQRKPAFHIFNTIVPMMFIVATSLGSFVVPRDETADRLSVSLTILLTTVAFKLQIGDSLPQISYLTLIDEFILSSIAFVILVVLSNAVVSFLSDEFDKFCFMAFAGLWLVMNLAFAFSFWEASKRNDIQHWNRFGRYSGDFTPEPSKGNLAAQLNQVRDDRDVGI
mmetsp:Transcript_4128/g.7719  ORF Transcript_4128/g.7719 Transcript_4128/m.7719 type:complete len:402 (-) Transcript_4128:90-1295(-)